MSEENYTKESINLISEILDRMLDMQQSSTEAITSLRISVDESLRSVNEVNKHFKNGFRSEIKDHISKESKTLSELNEQCHKKLNDLKISLDKQSEMLERPGYWVKLILTTVAATTTAVGATVAVIVNLLNKN